MKLTDHIRLAFKRPFIALGEDITFTDGFPPPTSEQIEATRNEALALFEAEKNAPILADARLQMAAAFDSMPLPAQAYFWTTRVAVESALDKGRTDIALEIVRGLEVTPELEPLKAQISTLIGNA